MIQVATPPIKIFYQGCEVEGFSELFSLASVGDNGFEITNNTKTFLDKIV